MDETGSDSQRDGIADKGSTTSSNDSSWLTLRVSPVSMLAITIAGIFLAEVIAMILIRLLPDISFALQTLLDALIMVALIYPLVYYLIFRSLIVHIAERERVEAVLRRYQEHLEELVDERKNEIEAVFSALQDGVLVYNKDMKVVKASPSFLANYQFNPIGLHLKEIIEKVSCRWLDGRLFRLEDQPTPSALRGEKVTGAQYLITRPDGADMIVETSSAPLWLHDQVIGSVTVWHDITQQKQAENRLAYLATFPERNPNPVIEVDFNGGVQYANPAAQRIVPDLQEQGLAHDWLADWNTITHPFHEGQTNVIARIVTVDDRIYEQSLYYLDQDDLIRVYSTDITQRKRAEEALLAAHDELELRVQERTQELAVANMVLTNEIAERERAESELRLLSAALEAAANGVIITGFHGNIRWANQAFTQMTGYTLDEVLGQNPRLLRSGKQATNFYRLMWETILSGQVWRGEMINRRKDDSLYYEEQTITPLINKAGEITNFIAIKQDITERKRSEQALIHYNELLDRYFSSIDTLIAYMDRDFNFIRVNESYAKSAGHPPEFLLGKNHFDLYPHPENLAIFQRVVETGEPFSVYEKPFEYPEYPERGATYWDWSLQPVKEPGGAVQGVVLSLVDVTQRKQAELQLARQNQELLELSIAEHNQRELAETLVEVSLVLNTSLELDRVLCLILSQIRKTIPFQGGKIMLLEGKSLHVASFLGYEGYPEGIPTIGKSYSVEDYPILQQVRASLQPVIVDSPIGHPVWRGAPGLEWVGSALFVPLHVGGEVIGIINLDSELPSAFTQEAVDRLLAFAAPASLAIQNARLYTAESHERQLAETLRAAAQELTESLDLDQVLRTLMDHIHKIITCEISGVGLLDQDERLAVRVADGYPLWTGPDHIFSLPVDSEPNTLFNKVITTRKSQLITDTATEPLSVSQPEVEQIRNWLLVPIIANENVIGMVGLGNVEPGFFTQDHVQWVEALVNQASVAIQNAWLFQQVRSSSERLQSLARKLVEIQENERYHIARELHDDAGQALSLLKLSLGRLEQDPECPQHVRQRLDELKGVTDGVLEELHRLAVDLRPIALDHLGLVAAIEQYAKNLNSDRLTVQFKALGFEGDRLPKDMEVSLYRIVQEALANVIRHAQAGHVGILMERRQGRVILFVEDDGVGFDSALPETTHRLGLVGMRERAEMFGGTLTIESYPGKGTSVIVEVPDANSYPYRG